MEDAIENGIQEAIEDIKNKREAGKDKRLPPKRIEGCTEQDPQKLLDSKTAPKLYESKESEFPRNTKGVYTHKLSKKPPVYIE